MPSQTKKNKTSSVPRMRMNDFLAITKVNRNGNGSIRKIHAKARPGRTSKLLAFKRFPNIGKIFGKKTRRTYH
jgi:hypothetical protein